MNEPLSWLSIKESCSTLLVFLFSRNPLIVAGTKNESRYFIPDDTPKSATLRYKVRLPPYLTCTQCVLQWKYRTGTVTPCHTL